MNKIRLPFYLLCSLFIPAIAVSQIGQFNEVNAANVVPSTATYDYSVYNHYQQYWNNPSIIYNESVTFVQQSNGSIQGRLYYNASKILSIKDYNLENDLDLSLFDLSGNVLTIKNPVHTPGLANSIAYFTKENYAGDASSLSLNSYLKYVGVADASITSTPKKILHTEDIGIARMHFYVTYERDSASTWGGSSTPVAQTYQLQNTIKKLSNKSNVKIVFNGDSIVTGAMTSGFLNEQRQLNPSIYGSKYSTDPMKVNEPIYSQAFGEQLKRLYDYPANSNAISVINTAVGGTISDWGANNIQNNVLKYNPDLVVLGFGTNDGAYAYRIPVSTYKSNMTTMVNAIKNQNPDTEIILMYAIKPNPESQQHCYMQDQYGAALTEIASSNYGVTVLNMWDISVELYKKKLAIDMLANNINHPNDWLERVYVSGLLTLMGAYGKTSLNTEALNTSMIYDPWGSGYSKANSGSIGVKFTANAGAEFYKRLTITKRFKLDGLSFDFKGGGLSSAQSIIGFYLSPTSECKYFTEIGNTLTMTLWPNLYDNQDRVYAYNTHDYHGKKSYLYSDEACTKMGFGVNDMMFAMAHNASAGFRICFSKYNSSTWKVVLKEINDNTFKSFDVQNIVTIGGKKAIVLYMKNSDVANKMIDSNGNVYLNFFSLNNTSSAVNATFTNVTNGEKAFIRYLDISGVYIKRLVDVGSKVSAPAVTPTREGLIIQGWYKDSDFTNQWDFSSDTVNSNTTIYAKWVTSQYRATLNQVGGSGGLSSIDFVYGTKLPTLSALPTKAGYAFAGYYDTLDNDETGGTGNKYYNADGTAYKDRTYVKLENITLYAKWTKQTYTLTLNNQNATTQGTDKIYTKYNQGYYLTTDTVSNNKITTSLHPITVPTKTGYNFAGYWTDISSGTQIINADGYLANSSVSTRLFTNNDTLYAHWTIATYTVTFDTNGGSDIASQNVDYNSVITRPNDPIKTNSDTTIFTFAGWYSDSGLTTPYNFATKITSNITIYAKWNEKLIVIDNVDKFCLNFMHPEISFYDQSNTGACKGETGYYKLAKDAFNLLSAEEKTIFNNNEDYINYKNRLIAWADANGEIYNGNNFIANQLANNVLINNHDDNYSVLIIVLSIAAPLLLTSFLYIKRKKTK